MSGAPQSMDEILASIGRIVSEGAPPPPPVVTAASPEPAEAPPAPAAASPAGPTLETTVRAMLEPQLKAWLDANLPEIVERVVQAEVRRLTRS